MKHKTWFRLCLKAIGILLIGLGLEDLTRFLIDVSLHWNTVFGGRPLTQILISSLPNLIQTIFGLYLFLDGSHIVNFAIPSGKPSCPECGYELTRSTAPRCPECGTLLPAELHSASPDSSAATDAIAASSSRE